MGELQSGFVAIQAQLQEEREEFAHLETGMPGVKRRSTQQTQVLIMDSSWVK
jgi:hypothetical protein